MIDELEAITPRQNDDDNTELSILYSEVKLTFKKFKQRESPGTGGVYSGMLQTGGVELAKQIHRLCCNG